MSFLSSIFAAPMLLAGLLAVSIPVIIHLLNRRRFEVVDWGAMQFLHVSETVRRRFMIEDVLLLLLRMLLIAVLVLGMATPLLPGSFWAWLGNYFPSAAAQRVLTRPSRDLVFVIDGSARMSYTEKGPTTEDAARDWAKEFLDHLGSGDSVAVILAREKPITIIGEPTVDLAKVRQELDKLPPPSGGCNWPEAVNEAIAILQNSKQSHRDIFLIGDGSVQGLADNPSLVRWKFDVTPRLKNLRDQAPRLVYVNAAPDREADPPNWTVLPLRSTRAVTSKGREVTFRTGFELAGQTQYQPPHSVYLLVDEQRIKPDVKAPNASTKLDQGKVAIEFNYTFPDPGVHLVSLVVEPDLPGQHVKDRVAADNRQDMAIEVVSALPVLLVDGDPREHQAGATKLRGGEFLQAALAPPIDPAPVVALRMVGISQFDPKLLTENVTADPGTKPRVLILANVAKLTPEQMEAIGRFISEGGGVLVTAGNRADVRFYNEQLYRGGEGWLPAKLEAKVDNSRDWSLAANPNDFTHPAVDLFKRWREGPDPIKVLEMVKFPRWWKLATGNSKASETVCKLTDTDPFLVEKKSGKGRVILCAVPLDDTWETNLTDTDRSGALVPLAHELVYYLAGARSAEFNLKAGQPIQYRPPGGVPAGPVVVYPPQGNPQTIVGATAPLVYNGTNQTGVYKVEEGGRPSYYVVQPEGRPSLALASESDRENLGKQVKITFENDRAKLALPATDQPTQMWWPLLIGVILLMCGEVWMTRRIALSR